MDREHPEPRRRTPEGGLMSNAPPRDPRGTEGERDRTSDADYRALLLQQLENANAARIAEVQTTWAVFALFGGGSLALLGIILDKGARQTWKLAAAGLVFAMANALVLGRVIAHLEKHESLVRRIETTLQLRAEHRLTGAPPGRVSVRTALLWLAWFVGGFWVGLLMWGFGVRL
jgi:hypothetical protein